MHLAPLAKSWIAALCIGVVPTVEAGPQSLWSVRAEGGRSAMHSSDRTGGAWAVRVMRDFRSARFARLAFGVSSGAADEGFFALDLMMELAPLSRFPLTPVVALGGGLLGEPEWGGVFMQAAVGAELRVLPRLSVRGAQQWGSHGGQLGPHMTTVGVALRFGSRPRAS